jgi:hypothetical protein
MKKDSRGGSLRIPPDLHKKLGHYAVDNEVSMAQAIERAWEAFTNPINQRQIAESDKSAIKCEDSEISEEEFSWVLRLLRVIRSKNPILKNAIEQNLIAFNWLAEAADERPGDPAPPARAFHGGTDEALRRTREAAGSAARTLGGHAAGPRGGNGGKKKTG